MSIVYLRLKKKIKANKNDTITLRDLSYISSTNKDIVDDLGNTVIYTIGKHDEAVLVIDSFIVIKHLNRQFANCEFQLLGPTETIVYIKEQKLRANGLYIAFVWLLLFIGTAMTIMNFHYDVSMQEVQQNLHLLFTGEENEFPLLIQIPYSLGLGLGMIIYLNHWFKKKLTDEPSPLEIELYNYQLNLDQYVKHYENDLNEDNRK